MAAQPQGPPPRIVLPVDEPRPVLDYCFTNKEVLVEEFPNDPNRRYATIDVVKAANPQQAYVIIPSIERVSLEDHGEGWGYICVGMVLPRLEEGAYQMPSPEDGEKVAIKFLNKRVVEDELMNGDRNDPYREILRMQTIGDNVHVLGCIEALEDENCIYLVMPYCDRGHPLTIDFIPQEVPEDHEVHHVFRQILENLRYLRGSLQHRERLYFQQIIENLRYLRDHRICHGHLVPNSCRVYRGRIVFCGFSRSFRLPPDALLVHGRTTPHGNPEYQPPEVFSGEPYNAYGCDLWAAVVILFEMLTGEKLYHWPSHEDLIFRFFIMARGLSRRPIIDVAQQMLREMNETQQQELARIITIYVGLSPDVREIFEHVLRMDPQERWDLDAVAASAYLNPPI
jgi:serine/threonine protein kinase